jgi:mannose-6-phosphate isomerase-like protein (cupin superfamily)
MPGGRSVLLVVKAGDRPEITANDGCRLRELLHPERDDSGLPYSVAVARVEPGEATHPHFLESEQEVYYILGGSGRMHVGSESSPVGPGDAVVIPAGATQWIECLGEESLTFLALVSPPWRADHDIRSD